MKTKITAVIGLAAICAYAQMLPIQDPAESRNYGLSISKFGTRSVGADTMNWSYPGAVTYTTATNQYGEAVLDQLFNTEFVYQLANPGDIISGYVYLYDKPFDQTGVNQPNLLFYGTVQYTLADLATGKKPSYSLWQMYLPLPLSNVASAEILALNTNGVTADRIQLIVKDGHPLFPSWYSGAPNGLLSVRFNNGSLMTYMLANPTGHLPKGSVEDANWTIPDHYAYTSGRTNTPNIKIIAVFNRPSVFVDVQVLKSYPVDVMAMVQLPNGQIIFVRPPAILIQSQNGGPETRITLPDQPTTIQLPLGQWRARFDWQDGVLEPGLLYTGPSDGVGTTPVSSGGGGSSPVTPSVP